MSPEVDKVGRVTESYRREFGFHSGSRRVHKVLGKGGQVKSEGQFWEPQQGMWKCQAGPSLLPEPPVSVQEPRPVLAQPLPPKGPWAGLLGGLRAMAVGQRRLGSCLWQDGSPQPRPSAQLQ